MIIGLEGVSCTGKTTLARALAERLGTTTVIPCYYHAAPDPSVIPNPEVHSEADQLHALTVHLEIEELRRQHVREAVQEGHLVVLDRTVDTLLAHLRAVGLMAGLDANGPARALVEERVAQDQAVSPDVTLLLHADHALVADRARSRTGMLPLYYDLVADRTTAKQLLASPEGQEPQLRSAALTRARQDSETATGERGAAQNQVEQRSSELEVIERVYRQPPRRTLPVVPTSSQEADALAAEQETRNQRAQERLTQAEGLITGVEQQTTQAENRKTLLGTLLESLPDPGEHIAEPFTDDEDTARTRSRQARDAVTTAAKALSGTEAGLNTSVDRLRRTAARFAGISGPMKDRDANDPPALLGPHAEDLGAKLWLRAQTLADELGSIAQDQAIISEGLAHLVKESLDMLGKAERASHMKTGSGSWADKKVLRISFDRPGDTDLVVYAERVIDRLVEKGLKPEGIPLLKAAVHEAAGPRGFTVKVLKPTDDNAGTTEDISRLAKWSGGEKLTVCVALYCTLAALRAAHTGRKGRSGGVLLLDNPIGRASSASLVRLQRDVAASHSVQLIYTTGVKDPAAVVQFPNVIRLDNREGRTRNRRYIVPEDRPEQTSYVTGIRVAHTDHPWDSGSSTEPHESAG